MPLGGKESSERGLNERHEMDRGEGKNRTNGPGIAYCSARREYEKEFEKGVGS